MSNIEKLQSIRAEVQNASGVLIKAKANLDNALRIIDDLLGRAVPQPAEQQVVDYQGNPVAQNLASLLSAKQLGMINALCRELGILADDESNRLYACRSGELSKAAASTFIKHLQDRQRRIPLRRAN